MEDFGAYRTFTGLTFVSEKGKVNYLKTVRQSHPWQFIQDCRQLDLSGYDLVITDFEPISAWAARRAGVPCLGVGHQYAFNYPIPRAGNSWLTDSIMRYFAPAQYSLGLHWHHFGQPILPPIIANEPLVDLPVPEQAFMLVYLPFEDTSRVLKLLQQFSATQFAVYSNACAAGAYGNVRVHPLSRQGFQTSLHQCSGVICNTGFELISEALSLGKPILTKPLAGQMEQLSNAAALDQLGLASLMPSLDARAIDHWLNHATVCIVNYPNVAAHICDWLLQDRLDHHLPLCQQLWQLTDSPQDPHITFTLSPA